MHGGKAMIKILFYLDSLLPLTHFMSLVSLYIPWKYQKTSGFLMFSGGIEINQWHEMGYCRGLFFWKSLNLSYLQGFGYVFVMVFYENVRAWTHIFFIPSINEEISANKYILKVNQINASKKLWNMFQCTNKARERRQWH